MILTEDATYSVSTGVDPSAKPLATASPGNFLANYERVQPGRYSLKVSKAGAGDKIIKVLDANIPDKGYFTILVSADAAGNPVVELLNDTPDYKSPPGNHLVIRQMIPGAHAVVTAGSQRSNSLDFGQSQVLDNMPDGRVPVSVHATTSKGQRNWASEADFSGTRRSTVFVAPDAYGRTRLRYTSDGPDAATEKENRAAPAQ